LKIQQGRTNPALSLTLLGTFACIGGFLCLFLPETLGEDLPNTLDEGEAFGKNQSFWNCPICAKYDIAIFLYSSIQDLKIGAASKSLF
jgi:hypothetical protein